jgi:hypothetical protein
VDQRAEQDLVGQRLLDRLADHHSGVNTRSSAELELAALALPWDRRRGRRRSRAWRRHLAAADVRRHDQHDVAEVGLAPVVVGQRGVVHHLQQDVEQVGVGLLDLVEEQHAVRVLVDRVGEQAALIEADVAGRRADQPRHRVLLHVLRHVEAEELDAQGLGELLGQLGLADAGRPGEQEVAGRLVGVAQASARQLDGGGDLIDRGILAEDGLA